MDRFRQLGPASRKGVPGGLVDYLSLTPAQRHADYLARAEKAAREHPSDPAAQFDYLKALLEDRKTVEATALARRLAALKPGPVMLAEAGRAMLEAGLYAPARELLTQARDAPDLALAAYRMSGPQEAMALLDDSAESHLARTIITGILDEKALRPPVGRADLYRQAAIAVAKKGDAAGAIRLLSAGIEAVPKDRELPLLHAVTLQLAGRSDDAERAASELASRWPEWPAVWVAEGVILESQGRAEEARRALGTAQALGARTPVTGPRDLRALFWDTPSRDW